MRLITTGDMMHVHGGFGAQADYTARISVKLDSPVDETILRRALVKAQKRYPYLNVHLKKGEGAFYYVKSPGPVALLHTDDRITLNSDETNGIVWAVCWNEDRIHLDTYHGVTDGTGMYRVLATLLYYYCNERYGVTEQEGIGLAEDKIPPEELADPQDTIRPFACDIPTAVFVPAFTLETDGGLTPSEPTIWDVEIPEEAFIRFTSANDASPGTMVSLIMARAIDSLYPDRSKEIVSAYVINARPMLDAGKTYHNCLSMAIFNYDERVKRMPLTRQCTVYRGRTFVQSYGEAVRNSVARSAEGIREAARNAITVSDKKEVFKQMFNGGEGYVSFLVSYTGKWQYPALGEHILELWAHPPNTFSLMVEIGAAGGKIFLSIQQRFRENTIREEFLGQLRKHGIPYEVKRVMGSDIARFPEP